MGKIGSIGLFKIVATMRAGSKPGQNGQLAGSQQAES